MAKLLPLNNAERFQYTEPMTIYTLKLLIGKLIMPLNLLLLVCFCCLILLLRRKIEAVAKTFLALALITFYAISTTYVANAILAPLEFKYPPYQQTNNRLAYIVVLGCSHSKSGHLPSSSYLYGCSQVRLHEALRLYQLNPGAKVIFTGAGGDKGNTLADTMALFAREVGIRAADIIVEPRPSDTIEEVALVSPVIVDANSAIVTSAAHMPRAMLLFKRQGVDITPAPTDYLIRYQPRKLHLLHFIPAVYNLDKVDHAFHEYYGLVWLFVKDLLP
jgi:uncharacterized SAM-binding protein YcdF (DUF218 family)